MHENFMSLKKFNKDFLTQEQGYAETKGGRKLRNKKKWLKRSYSPTFVYPSSSRSGSLSSRNTHNAHKNSHSNLHTRIKEDSIAPLSNPAILHHHAHNSNPHTSETDRNLRNRNSSRGNQEDFDNYDQRIENYVRNLLKKNQFYPANQHTVSNVRSNDIQNNHSQSKVQVQRGKKKNIKINKNKKIVKPNQVNHSFDYRNIYY